MNSASVLPPYYAYLEGCAALGGHSTLCSPRCLYSQSWAGCRGFCAAYGDMYYDGIMRRKKGGVNGLGKLRKAILTF
jgi:hypothetical protein